MKNSQINFDIFSQNITPISTYILAGDKKPEIEIKSLYLNKIINKEENKIKINDSPVKTGKTGKEKKILNSIKVEENPNYSGNHLQITNGISLKERKDKLPDIILPVLHSQGEYSDTNINIIELSNEQKNKFKLTSNNPYILSFNNLHPFSIFFGTKYNKLIKKNNELMLPAPYYIEKSKWCEPEDNTLKGVLEGVKIVDELGLVLDAPELKKKFSGLVGDIIIQVLKIPFGHHISLNIKIFEPNTVLSRYTKIFSYANTYLIPASNPKLIPYERFKLVITFLFSGLYICCKQLKPFNPFLGETYEGEFENGAKIYVENVTHKPLVARFLITYKKVYEISGYWDLQVLSQGLGNEITIHQKGPIRIKFPEINECYVGHIPFGKAINSRSDEKRATLFFGSLVCVDPKHHYKAWIQFNFNKKVFHEIRGCTMHYDFPSDYEFNADKEWEFGLKFSMEKDKKINQKKTKMNDDYTIFENITGSFIDYLKIGDDVLWKIEDNHPEPIRPVKYCIPSDGRFREDLIWLYRGFFLKDEKEQEIYREIGMKWKVMMEEFNRWERKHRADYKALMKKKNINFK